MAKTINELLEEFNDPPFTAEDFKREKLELEKKFMDHYGIHPEEIDVHINTGRFSCTNALAERWISLMEVKRYIDEE